MEDDIQILGGVVLQLIGIERIVDDLPLTEQLYVGHEVIHSLHSRDYGEYDGDQTQAGCVGLEAIQGVFSVSEVLML